MPPRKKAKASAASTPLAEAQPRTPQDTGATQSQDIASPPQNENLLNDPWTDDQETQLFKSMIKWKPTGIHKHFRMISIHNSMRSHGFVTDDTPHTRIPGIWRRLHALYDLDALDARENAYTFHDKPDPVDLEKGEDIAGFELPEDEFGEMIWQARFAPESEGTSSPPLMPIEDDKTLYQLGFGLLQDLPNGPSSQRAESVAETTPAPKGGKSTRSSRATAKAQKAVKAGQDNKKSKAQSVSEEEEDEEDENDEEEDEDEDESEDSEEETAPTTRSTNRSGRGRAAPKRTRKR